MTAPSIENRTVRYVASFAVVLATVGVGTLTAVALPESVPYTGLVSKGIILLAAVVGVYAMLRIEEGPGPFARRLP